MQTANAMLYFEHPWVPRSVDGRTDDEIISAYTIVGIALEWYNPVYVPVAVQTRGDARAYCGWPSGGFYGPLERAIENCREAIRRVYKTEVSRVEYNVPVLAWHEVPWIGRTSP